MTATPSEREKQILALMLAGHSNKQIGRALGLDTKTVKNYLTVAYRKLDVVNRTQAVMRALQLGWVALD